MTASRAGGRDTAGRAVMGVNINDSCQDYTGQILAGLKTVETRPTRSLDPYIGQRVGIVRTGMGRGTRATLVGYATIGEPVFYRTRAAWRAARQDHLVAPGSAHDWTPAGKYGYPLADVIACDPVPVYSRGNIARRIA